MSANLHNIILQGHPKTATNPSTATHPHNDNNSKTLHASAENISQTSTANHSAGPAAQLEISPEAQAMINHISTAKEAESADKKIKSPTEAKALLQATKQQILDNPAVAKEVHSNLDVMRIIQKVL